jgi:hypothetical protein
MKLFTKDIDKKLFQQYQNGSDLDSQVAVAKIFNPYGNGRWFLLNSDPQDPDYLWAIVQMGDIVEVGSVLRSELESVRVSPFKFPLERDLSFTMVNAGELYRGLLEGKFYQKGGSLMAAAGMEVGRYYKDKNGDTYRYIGENSQRQTLFNDGQKVIVKSIDDFEEQPKEKKLFGIFEDGGFVDKTDEELKGMTDDELFEYLDAKAFYMKQYAKPLSSFKAKNYAANSVAIQFQNEGTDKLDANFPSLSKINEQATKDYQETISKKSEKMAHGGYMADGVNGKTINGYDVDYFKTARGVYANIEIPSPNPTFDDDTQIKGFGKDEKEAFNDLKKEFEKYLKSKDNKMAMGGMSEHGLKVGDKIVADEFWDKKIIVENSKTKKRAEVDLEKGKRKEEMAMGGRVKFQDKVKAIKASLLKTKKVPKKVQKDYGKTYNAKEAELAAKRIAGAMAKKGIK